MRDPLKGSGFVPSFRNLRDPSKVRKGTGECGTLLRGPVLSRHFETCGDPFKVRRGLENAGPS
jgi:hypothetical protein